MNFLNFPVGNVQGWSIQPNEWTPIDAASDTINALSDQIK